MASSCPDPVFPVLSAIASCATAQLDQCGRSVCHMPVTFSGQPPPADWCDCTCTSGDGHGWVRMASVTAAYGTGSQQARGGCAGGVLDLSIGLGVYRCWPTPEADEVGLDPEVEQTAAAGLHLDAAALRRAVLCCPWLDRKDVPAVFVSQSAIGPDGGCVGVETTAQVRIQECCT